MKRMLLAVTAAAVAGLAAVGPVQAAPAAATVDAAARGELHRDHWQRAVTHARRLDEAVKEEAARRDYADDLPAATQFQGSPARRRFEHQARLRRTVTPANAAEAAAAIVSPGERLRDAVASAAPQAAPAAVPAEQPAAAPLPAPLGSVDPRLAPRPRPAALRPRPQGPLPVTQTVGVAPLPTLDQAVDPLMPGELTPLCPGARPGAKRALRAGCVAPRGI